MIQPKTFYRGAKIFATATLILSGLVGSILHPGPTDFLSAVAVGSAIYAIWFARERTLNE